MDDAVSIKDSVSFRSRKSENGAATAGLDWDMATEVVVEGGRLEVVS